VGKEFKHIGLFEGIGGFSLAARWAGWETVAWCEWNEFGQKVLRHHFPEAEGFGDITKTDFTKYANRIDILTGGFPCQPYSLAGKGKGKEDERHLWPEMLRAIREIQPPWVVGENVFGLINWNGGMVFNEVQADLETEGYEVWAYVLPACAINAPHRRDRVWFVAYSDNAGDNTCKCRNIGKWAKDSTERKHTQHELSGQSLQGIDSDTRLQRQAERQKQTMGTNELCQERNATNARCSERENWIYGEKQTREATKFGNGYTQFGRFFDFPTVEPTIRGGNDGIPRELDGITFPKWRNESIKAYGNAIVPQVAYEIFKAINQMAALADKERGAVFNNFQTEQSNGNEE
jgi:DNA (cytosine-5)-methyltransferase 1